MARFPDGVAPDALTRASRRVLLDALDALTDHRDAIVLVGAQAVYLRTANAPLAVAGFTSDADLSLRTDVLLGDPTLERAMASAGFTRETQPGTWSRSERIDGVDAAIAVDLLVAESFAGRGTRGVTAPPHDRHAMRRVAGLEPATVDFDSLAIASLEPESDTREVAVNVAGPAALLVAKAFKIRDRLADGRPGREADKDAGDVLRLMMVVDVGEVVARFQTLLADSAVADTTEQGLDLLRTLFGAPRSAGTNMAVGALAGAGAPEQTLRRTAAAFTGALPR